MSGKLPAVLSSADVYNMKVRRGGNTLHSCWLIIKWALRPALPQTAAFISHVYFWDQIQKLQWKKKTSANKRWFEIWVIHYHILCLFSPQAEKNNVLTFFRSLQSTDIFLLFHMDDNTVRRLWVSCLLNIMCWEMMMALRLCDNCKLTTYLVYFWL